MCFRERNDIVTWRVSFFASSTCDNSLLPGWCKRSSVVIVFIPLTSLLEKVVNICAMPFRKRAEISVFLQIILCFMAALKSVYNVCTVIVLWTTGAVTVTPNVDMLSKVLCL